MIARNATIFLGDVVEAVHALNPSGPEAEQTRRMIAELLGFENAPAEPMAPAALASREPEQERAFPKKPISKPPAESVAIEPAAGAVRWLPSTLKTRRAAPLPDTAPRLAGFKALPPPELAPLAESFPRLNNPLFEPAWSRAIFTALLGTWREGEIDLEILIEKVSRREVIERLPTSAASTLRRGVQVLVDTSRALLPFAADQAWALGEIEGVAGRELVSIWSFNGLPTRGISNGIFDDPKPYVPPLPGTTVVLLSDLGIAWPIGTSERASVQEWMAFARRVRHAGCPLVALLPYAPSRWPRPLRRLINMVHWDPRTTAGRVRATIGRAHHVK